MVQRATCNVRIPTLIALVLGEFTPIILRGQSPEIEIVGQLPSILSESSGIAVSRANPGVLWTHNDSDNDPILYAIDITGELLGTFALEPATMRDWEDMSLGPCVDDHAARCLYVADTGDNMRQWSVYTVYIVVEPVVSPGIGVDPTTVGRVRRLDFRYPGAPHDAEGLAVTPGGDIYIVTKGWEGTARVFLITRDVVEDAVKNGATITASAVESLTIETGATPFLITGAAISPSGNTMVARTYLGLHFFDMNQEGGFEAREQPCMIGYREPQGEAVDFLDESTLVLTSESLRGRPGTIHRVKCEG